MHAVRHDVVEQPLVVGDDQRGPARGSLSALTSSATMRIASMSRPESVSSSTQSEGSSSVICKISLRFFSPPEKPTFNGRLQHLGIDLEQLRLLAHQTQKVGRRDWPPARALLRTAFTAVRRKVMVATQISQGEVFLGTIVRF